MSREPSEVAVLAARLARAFGTLSSYSAAMLATELCAIERAQRRHAERCCGGADGGYVKRRRANPSDYEGAREIPPMAWLGVVAFHDKEAEDRARVRIVKKVKQWKNDLANFTLGCPSTDIQNTELTLKHDPRGPVLLLKLPGEAEAVAV